MQLMTLVSEPPPRSLSFFSPDILHSLAPYVILYSSQHSVNSYLGFFYSPASRSLTVGTDTPTPPVIQDGPIKVAATLTIRSTDATQFHSPLPLFFRQHGERRGKIYMYKKYSWSYNYIFQTNAVIPPSLNVSIGEQHNVISAIKMSLPALS